MLSSGNKHTHSLHFLSCSKFFSFIDEDCFIPKVGKIVGGSLTKKTVEENWQKINVLGCGSVVFIVGYLSPSCVRGDSCAG